jgi:hypothetical protein
MPVATAEDIDANLTAWYTSLSSPDGPTTTAAAYATLGAELRARGNPNNTGPQFLVVNTGQGQLQLLSGLIERPASIPDMPALSPFAQTPYIAILGNRNAPEEDWIYGHITPDALLGSRSNRLAAWGNIKAPPRNDTGLAWGLPRTGALKDHHPMLPLYGKDICTTMVNLLHPPNAADKATIKAAGNALKAYIDAIPTATTKASARASLLGLITNAGANAQAGTIDFGTAAGEDPATKAALKDWTDALVAKTLHPTPPRVSFSLPTDTGTATLHTGGQGTATPSTLHTGGLETATLHTGGLGNPSTLHTGGLDPATLHTGGQGTPSTLHTGGLDTAILPP